MKSVKNNLFVFGIPVLYAFALRTIFVSEFGELIVGIISVVFLIVVPASIGGLTIALAPAEISKKALYKIFAPWVPIIFFLSLTFLLKFEGAICLVMALPIFLVGASAGGLIVGFLKERRINNKINVIAVSLLPFLISPIEKSLDIKPIIYEARTSVIIEASKEKIWENVVRVKEINEAEDNGKLSKVMGFPRPIKAELDVLGIGGRRRAIFDKGLVFDETVNVYETEKKMSFSITPLTEEIPPETLDEHVIVGGQYFTVLDGTYELEPAGNDKYNLILYSHFRMSTSINFYSGLWGKWIMKDIQNNILEIIKKRCEN